MSLKIGGKHLNKNTLTKEESMNKKYIYQDVLELADNIHIHWEKQAPDGDVLKMTDHDYELRRIYDQMIRYLGYQIFLENKIVEHFDNSPGCRYLISQDQVLSERTQQIFKSICMFVGLNPDNK